MHLIRLIFRTSPAQVALAALVAAASGLVTAALIALLSTAIRSSEAPEPWMAWSFAGLAIIALTTRVTSQVMLIRLAQGAIFNLRMQLSRRIMSVPIQDLEKTGAARILGALTEDVAAIADAIQGLPFLCFSVATVLGCLGYLTWLSWSVALSVLLVAIPGVVVYRALQHRAVAWMVQARQHHDALLEGFRGLTEGAKELKLHRERRAAFLDRAIEDRADDARNANWRGIAIYSVAGAWSQLLLFAVVGFLALALPAITDLDRATLVSYSITILYMLRPVDYLLHTMPILGRAGVSFANIESLGLSLGNQTSDISTAPVAEARATWHTLDLSAIVHAYRVAEDDRHFQLGPLSLRLHTSEIVFITGGNGSGKSTLLKVLGGLYAPQQGTIELDGTRIDDASRDWYRQHFSAVFADYFLFYELYGLDPGHIENRAKGYLEQLRLERHVRVSQTHIDAPGLSQGQRKRLALLTAYLEDRPIYLFDEWASDQDPVFKELFYTELLDRLKAQGKLVVVATHDDRYFHVADRVIKLDEGQIIADESVGGEATITAPNATSS